MITQETNPVYWAYAHCLTLEPRLVSCFHHLCSKSFHFIVKSGTGKCGAGKCSRLQCCCCYVRCCCYCSWLFEKRQKTLVGVSTLIFCVHVSITNFYSSWKFWKIVIPEIFLALSKTSEQLRQNFFRDWNVVFLVSQSFWIEDLCFSVKFYVCSMVFHELEI